MNMKRVFAKDKAAFLARNKAFTTELFTEEVIKDLPEPLKKYLRVCGYINTPIPINAAVNWTESWLKLSPDKEWGKLQTIQFNSVKPIGRVAYMKFISIPVAARDLYCDGYGEMKGKLLNLIPVVFDNSKEVAQSALITAFCEFFFIPGYLLVDAITWEQLNAHSVRGTLEDNGITVSGIFYFNDEGLMTRFETNDRYYSTGKQTYQKVPFSALVDSYRMQGNLKICENVRIVWHLPEGDYEYYKGIVESIECNVHN